MIAKIFLGKSIRGLLHYHENKVENGEARLIGGANLTIGKHYGTLTYEEKVGAFHQVIERKKNARFENTAFHVSLSLDPCEKPTDVVLRAIAGRYIKEMGYQHQPYLVYRHEDMLHPHIHIVSTTVDRSGKKINNDFSKKKSEKIRKKIEQDFGLVVAVEKEKKEKELTPLKKVIYGKEETKKAVSNVIRGVLRDYKLTSLDEFSSLLAHYNVKAAKVRGLSSKGAYEGMVYSATDDRGKRQGRPMKASCFHSKPTLENLQKVFEKNREEKKAVALETLKAIEKVFAAHRTITKEDLPSKLLKVGINLQYHEGRSGVIAITIIDNVNKAVFKGSDLGKAYSWEALQTRLSDTTVEKTGVALLDRQTIQESLSALYTIYDKQLKLAQGQDYFESSFIRRLDKIDFLTPLLSMKKELTIEQATELSRGFKALTLQGLPELEAKEMRYYKSNVEMAMRFLYQAPVGFSGKERIEFLSRINLCLEEENGKKVIAHSKADHLKLPVEAGYYSRCIGGEAVRGVDTSTIKPYSKADKAFISAIAAGKITGSEIDLFTVRYAHFKPMLSEANARLVEKELTATYYKKLTADLSKTASGSRLAEELDKRGLQIIPINERGRVKEYKVQYFAFPEGKIPVEAPLSQQLHLENYNSHTPADTVKYRLLVDLHQSRDRMDASGIDRTLQKIEKLNTTFASILKKDMEPLRRMIAKGDSGTSDRLLGTMINTLIDRVGRYAGDTMQEMKSSTRTGKADLLGVRIDAGGKEFEENAKINTNTTFADTFSGTNESGGPEQDPKRNKGKKLKIQ